MPSLRSALTAALLLAFGASRGQYTHFEAQQGRPLCLSPDGTRLFALNTPDARLSVFDVSNPANPAPVLIREIPVGLEPVSVAARSAEEAWVVNELSDAVSVVSVAEGLVIDTLPAGDEPGEVVFASGRAFVSASRQNRLAVFDAATRDPLGHVALPGNHPRALEVSADGTAVFAAFKFSGNRTTLLPAARAPAPPAPTNPALPAPPQVGLIVAANDPRLSPAPLLPDHDIAEVSATALTVTRTISGTGTILFALALRPGTSELWVANTEARNLVRFEPALNGHSVDNRLTRVALAGPVVTAFDLNPGVDYNLLPNPAAQATALAQPTAIVFEPDGAHGWVAAFGSDRVARFNAATGAVVARVETGPTTGTAAAPRQKRGPRGLALQSSTGRLYVLNRLSNTITVLSTSGGGTVLAEVPAGSYDPTPASVREGRGFLYDARLSGNGTQSCASCHIDGDRDDLAWDLGDPGGTMQTVVSNLPLVGPNTSTFHPMKGPMTTQTLRGMSATEPLHWRGDRADFTHFNGAFASLLGGSQLTTPDMQAFRDFALTIRYHPNPNQNLDRTMPSSFPPGDPNAGNPNTGRTTYLNDQYQQFLTCNTCHTLPTGTGRFIVPAAALGGSQDFKVPQLRKMYMKTGFRASATVPSRSGFGFVHDGEAPDLVTFLSLPVFGTFATDTTRKRNLNAFLLCLDTGTAPATGYSRTASAATLPSLTTDWATLEAQAVAGGIDLILRGRWNGARRGFRYRPATNDYVSDAAGEGPFTRAQVQGWISSGAATLSLLGVPPGMGARLATDRDGDGTLDQQEILPRVDIGGSGGGARIAWPSTHAALVLECTESLETPVWIPVTAPRALSGGEIVVQHDPGPARRYYRLRQP